jgi:hypothetical protein
MSSFNSPSVTGEWQAQFDPVMGHFRGYPTSLASAALSPNMNRGHVHPSGSARSRVYIKPWSSIGLMSAVPPFAAAALLIASTASRLSHDRASITSLDVFGGMGRFVKVCHLAWVSSMKLIPSLHTMHAAVPQID